MAYNSANPFGQSGPQTSGVPRGYLAELFPGYFPKPEDEEAKNAKRNDPAFSPSASAPSRPAQPEIGAPPSAFGRTSELDDLERQGVREGAMEFLREPSPITAERRNGVLTFTNQGGQGDQVDLSNATQSVQGGPTQITSPYDRAPNGGAFSSATTRPGVAGGFIESQLDPRKVANPMAFEAFREPTENILAEQGADLAKSRAEQSRASALTEDPFAPERMRTEAAMAPYEARNRGEREGEDRRAAFLSAPPTPEEMSQAMRTAQQEAAQDPRLVQLNPQQRQEILRRRVEELVRENRQGLAEMIFGNISIKGSGGFGFGG